MAGEQTSMIEGENTTIDGAAPGSDQPSRRNPLKYLRLKLKKWTLRQVLLILLMGQILSMLLSGTAITSGLLQARNITIPTAQSFTNYVLLSGVFVPVLVFRQGDQDSLVIVLKERGWKYFLLSVVDVEGNYFMVKAYHYTTVTSVQLLSCFTIAVVLVLSRLVLKVRYGLVHVAGVLICLLGIGGLILTDVLTGKNDGEGLNPVVGDMMALGAASLYAMSNVGAEFLVKNHNIVELLAMMGMFGLLINGIQLAVLERDELRLIDFTNPETIVLLLVFAVCMFLYYALMPIVLTMSSAAVFNLSAFSAGFYGILIGILIFKYTFHPLYFPSFIAILLGVVIYCSTKTPHVNAEEQQSSQTDQHCFQADQDSFQTDHDSFQTDHDSFQADHASPPPPITSLLDFPPPLPALTDTSLYLLDTT